MKAFISSLNDGLFRNTIPEIDTILCKLKNCARVGVVLFQFLQLFYVSIAQTEIRSDTCPLHTCQQRRYYRSHGLQSVLIFTNELKKHTSTNSHFKVYFTKSRRIHQRAY